MGELDAGFDPEMSFAIDERDATAVVTINGELDISNVWQLEAAVTPLLTGGVDHLVLEVGDLTFADSSAIAVWVRWASSVDDLRLHGVSPLLQKVIETMGLGDKLRLQ